MGMFSMVTSWTSNHLRRPWMQLKSVGKRTRRKPSPVVGRRLSSRTYHSKLRRKKCEHFLGLTDSYDPSVCRRSSTAQPEVLHLQSSRLPAKLKVQWMHSVIPIY